MPVLSRTLIHPRPHSAPNARPQSSCCSPRPCARRDENPQYLLCISQDVTERSQAEAALLKTEKTLKKPQGNLRFLASQLFTIQEAECSRISKGFHGGLGQDVVALTFEGHALLMERLPQ